MHLELHLCRVDNLKTRILQAFESFFGSTIFDFSFGWKVESYQSINEYLVNSIFGSYDHVTLQRD